MLTALQRCMPMVQCSFKQNTRVWSRVHARVRHAVTAAAAQPAAGSLIAPRIPSSWMLTLEHPVSAPKQLDRQLAAAPFEAEVHPDLPIATTWQGLMRALRE
jgi:hypothetical protein